ncbi:MAG: hypothetical protein A2Z16_12325 [Chloroflexi bacterium RBG_16_54_18]|nr:MAG: hypothetical protein A2Z16_12325 [Chloroflexi bacterium RBG_16_54_18]
MNETIARQPELSQQAPLASLVAWIRLLVLNSIFHPAGWRLATWIGLQKMGDDERNWSYHLRRLTPSQAATGQSALVNLDRLNRSRYQNGQVLYRALKDIPGLACLATPEGAQASYLRFPILVADLERREQIFQQLDAAGIGVGKMYRKTLPEFFPELNLREYPGAAYVARHLLTLPVHQYIKKEHLELMIRTITSIAAVEETSCHSAIPIGLNHVD